MDTLRSALLSRLSFEMSAYEVVDDLLCLYNTKEDHDSLLLLLLETDDTDSYYDTIDLILAARMSEIEDEDLLMTKVIDFFQSVIEAPDRVFRPYQQHFITET